MIGLSPEFVATAVLNVFRGSGLPEGELTVELRKAATKGAAVAQVSDDGNQWTGFNRTVTSERYSPLAEINPQTASKLKVLCTYDTKKLEGNRTGIIMAEGALVGATAEDIFSIDPNNCKENWRVHKDAGLWNIPLNRGAAYLDGKVFRGFNDGFVRAFDLKTGKQLWETCIGQKDMIAGLDRTTQWGRSQARGTPAARTPASCPGYDRYSACGARGSEVSPRGFL